MRLLICAGGTGGGVYPALAVLQALEPDKASEKPAVRIPLRPSLSEQLPSCKNQRAALPDVLAAPWSRAMCCGLVVSEEWKRTW